MQHDRPNLLEDEKVHNILLSYNSNLRHNISATTWSQTFCFISMDLACTADEASQRALGQPPLLHEQTLSFNKVQVLEVCG